MDKYFFKTKKRPLPPAILIALVFLSSLLAIKFLGLEKKVQNVFLLASSPVETFLWQSGQKTSQFFDNFIQKKLLAKENTTLRLENLSLKRKISQLQELKQENQSLREALNLELEKDFDLLAAQIISKDPFNDAIFIDKGNADGLKNGWALISPQRILLGKITEVFENFSRVVLISDKSVSFDAEVKKISAENSEKIRGVAKGEGNNRLSFDLIPQEAVIEIGDKVITSSPSNAFPGGILAGEIEGINFSDVRPFRSAKIKPLFKISELKTIFIIKNY